jgi:hypothetical protein
MSESEQELLDKVMIRPVMLELRYDHHDKTIYALYSDLSMPSQMDFEQLVQLWRRFYTITPDDFVENWNKASLRHNFKTKSDKPAKPGYVYLAKSETGHHKIGISIKPKARIKMFDTKMPVAVELIHTILADDPRLAENILHTHFSGKRHNGEWFNLDEHDVEYIKNCTAFSGGHFLTSETIEQE